MAATWSRALTGGSSDTNGTSFTTASVSPNANALLLISVYNWEGDSSGAGAISSITGNGLTWVLVRQSTGLATPSMRLSIYCAQGASPSSGTITINFGVAQQGAIWSVVEFNNVRVGNNGLDAIAQTGTAAPGTSTGGDNSRGGQTFPNAITGDWKHVSFQATGIAANEAITHETGTEYHDIGITDSDTSQNRAMETHSWSDQDQAHNVSWTSNVLWQLVWCHIVNEDWPLHEELDHFIRFFDGFEDGDMESALATSGAPSTIGSIASPDGASGAFAIRCAGNATTQIVRMPVFHNSTTGDITVDNTVDNHVIIGIAFRTSDKTPSSDTIIIDCRNDAAISMCDVILRTDGDIWFRDETGALLASATDPLTEGEWSYIELAFEIMAASGDWQFWVDGTSRGAGTTGDFAPASGTNLADVSFLGPAAGDGNYDFDDYYILGSVTNSFRPGYNLYGAAGGGGWQIFAYQQDLASGTPDTGVTNNDTALDIGTWDDAGETPEAAGDYISYTGLSSPQDGGVIFDEGASSSGGHDGGPSTGAPYDVSGMILGAYFEYRLTRGNGSATSHEVWFGRQDFLPISISGNMTLASGAVSTFGFITDQTNEVPNADDDFAMGIGGGNTDTGGRPINGHAIWAHLLHIPSGAAPEKVPQITLTGVNMAHRRAAVRTGF